MKPSIVPIFLVSLVLTACSSGSDGGAAPPGQSAPLPALTLTSANAISVGKLSWDAANQSADMVDFVDNTGLTASSPGSVNKLQSAVMAIGSSGSTLQGIPFGPDDINCQLGFIRISGEIFDPFTPTLTQGDFFNSDFRDCDEGLGESIKGLVRMNIDSFAGELVSGTFDLTATLTLTNLQIKTAENVFLTNGAATVMLDTTMFPSVSASVSGSALTTDSNGSSETLFDFQTTQTIDSGLQLSPYTLDSSGTLETTVFTGAFSYSTPVPFQGFDLDYPGSGELLVRGNNSSVRLIALDNVNVRIEIDNDGDNVVDETIETTWANLTS
jgi:hypothetical protein